MKKFLWLASVAVVALSSCSTLNRTAATADVDSHVINYTMADLEVKETRVSKTFSWSFDPFKRVSVENVKENTTAELIEENGADVLLEPQYIIHKGGFLRGGSVTVTGIPAKYHNFHKMTPQEAEIVKALTEAGFTHKKKEKKRLFFFF